jgi:hypothetical protein
MFILGFLANWQLKISNSFVTFGETHAAVVPIFAARVGYDGTNMTALRRRGLGFMVTEYDRDRA